MQTSTMTTNTNTPRANRFPGPCSTCNTHVPAGAGFLRKIGARSIVDCAAHAGGSSGDAAANGSDAPASGGRPDVSADACAMVLALYRQADADPNVSPGHAALVAQIVRATLHCAGRSAVEIERAIKTPASAPPRGVGADLVDEILGRTASEPAAAPEAAPDWRTTINGIGEVSIDTDGRVVRHWTGERGRGAIVATLGASGWKSVHAGTPGRTACAWARAWTFGHMPDVAPSTNAVHPAAAPKRSRKPASSVRNAWAAMAADGEDK